MLSDRPVLPSRTELAAHLTDTQASWTLVTDPDERPWIVSRNVERDWVAWSWVEEKDYGRIGYDAARPIAALRYPVRVAAEHS